MLEYFREYFWKCILNVNFVVVCDYVCYFDTMLGLWRGLGEGKCECCPQISAGLIIRIGRESSEDFKKLRRRV